MPDDPPERDAFPHLDGRGQPRMVDVVAKPVTPRVATAEGVIRTSAETLDAISAGRVAKGNVLLIAQLAAITGAKRTADLIPLCHPLPLDAVEVEVRAEPTLPGVRVTATVRVEARTGVEMEALTAVTCGLLTIYDMCKSRDRAMEIGPVRLLRKSGGRSGRWERPSSE